MANGDSLFEDHQVLVYGDCFKDQTADVTCDNDTFNEVRNFDVVVHKHGRTQRKKIVEMMKLRGEGRERNQDVADLVSRVSKASNAFLRLDTAAAAKQILQGGGTVGSVGEGSSLNSLAHKKPQTRPTTTHHLPPLIFVLPHPSPVA